MADRAAGKVKKQAKKTSARSAGGAGKPRAQEPARKVNLAAECARLQAELDAARRQIEAMEAQRKELLDRINWAIDSLTSLHDT